MQLQSFPNAYSQSDLLPTLVPDYVSSVASRLTFSAPLRTKEFANPKPGDVVLARVEEVNPGYPGLELPDGSEVTLQAGMTIVGALGTRRALHGFSGIVPSSLTIGQGFQLLNKGGVIGDCTAFHRDLEWPTLLTYLGTVVDGARPVNLKDAALPLVEDPLPKVPLVMVLGTCMNSGKTTVCRTIINSFAQRGFHINAGKVAGVACRRDINVMHRAGAEKVISFQDFGYSSSADVESLGPVARSMVHHLAQPEPDFVVLEMGDGIIGGYHVSSLFKDTELMNRQVCMIICANDLMGVWGSLEWMRQNGYPPEQHSILVSGPVTDSCEGVKFIENNWQIPAANPFDSAGKMGSFVLKSLRPC
jgi:hypothetical protein